MCTSGSASQPRSVSTQRVIETSASDIFDVLATASRHAEIDGSGMLQGRAQGPDRLHLGAEFSMAMNQKAVRYTSSNEVVEFDDDRLICWQTHGKIGGRKFVGGVLWRYVLTPLDVAGDEPPRTLVRATYDWSRTGAFGRLLEVMGYPANSRAAMATTLQNLGALFAEDSTD